MGSWVDVRMGSKMGKWVHGDCSTVNFKVLYVYICRYRFIKYCSEVMAMAKGRLRQRQRERGGEGVRNNIQRNVNVKAYP